MSINVSKSEDNLFASLVNKYLPFWPLFVALLVLAVLGAWGYLRYMAIPTYEATASIIIKDTKKGVEDSRMTRSMDAFNSNNIVENEIKVIQSRALMSQVVEALGLYAPVFEAGRYKHTSAYTTSPIKITLRHPEKARTTEPVFFTYDARRQQVKIGSRRYALGQWVQSPYGELQFTRNDKQKHAATAPLYFTIIPPRRVTDNLVQKLLIQTENKLSTAVNLTLKDQVPEKAEDVLNQLIATYHQAGIDQRQKVAANTLQFVEDRIKLVGRELEELEKKVVRYKATKGVVDLSEQGKAYLSHAGETERDLADIDLQLAVLNKVRAYLAAQKRSGNFAPSTLGLKDPALTGLLEQLSSAEAQYQKLRKTTAENNPILLSLTDEIARTRQQVQENIANQLVSLQTSRARLASNRGQYNSALQSIPQKERELLEISRQQASKNEAYRFLLQKREEAVLSQAPSVEDTKIVDLAHAAPTPVSPKPMYLYVIAVVGACVTGIALVSGKELLTGKLLFRSEIEENTQVPIVGELSFAPSSREQLFQEPNAAFIVEQFRQMRVTLGLYGRTFTKRKLVVTSNIPGEGKSFVSTNLAYSLAASGRKVALVDFDLRNPNTTRMFEMSQQKGITEFLVEDIEPYEVINSTAYPHLYLVPAGIQVGDNTERLLNGKLEVLFAYLEKEFDYLVIDTPPIDLVTDAYLLSEYCDITLLVMRHAHTPKRLVQRLDQNRRLQAIANLAIVFNGVKSRGFLKKHYGYGYGYGHQNNYGVSTYQAGDISKAT